MHFDIKHTLDCSRVKLGIYIYSTNGMCVIIVFNVTICLCIYLLLYKTKVKNTNRNT